MTLRITAIGEAMLELSGVALDQQRLAFAGDTLNTAIGLVRLGVPTRYITALGDDPYSDRMVSEWQAEALDVSLIERISGALPGLYAIQTDTAGERRFFYWRKDSAARQLFDGERADRVTGGILSSSWVYLSGITLAIFAGARREALFRALVLARLAGCSIAFDPNYRPSLWNSRDEARSAVMQTARMASLVLPTFDDDAELFGDVTPEACAARYASLGVPEVIVKCGAEGAVSMIDATITPILPPHHILPVDTSGAGDAFNAGYLSARLFGRTAHAAALAGHRMAAVTLQHRGAIPPRTAVDAAGVLA